MPLSSIVRRAIDLNTVMGVTKQPNAVADAVSLIQVSDEAIKEAIHFSAVKLVHDLCTKAMRKLPPDTRQASLFLLHERYALDDDRVIKDTERLSEIEFLRIMALRKKQIKDDQKHYDLMVFAYSELSPIWREFPDKLLGEIERIWVNRRAAA